MNIGIEGTKPYEIAVIEANRRQHEGYSINECLDFANLCLDSYDILTHGNEYLRLPDGSDCWYINTGDTYSATVLFTDATGFIVSSWGDIFEENELDYCDNNKVIRCGYCGEFTPQTPEDDDWRDIVCDHCNHNISTGELA